MQVFYWLHQLYSFSYQPYLQVLVQWICEPIHIHQATPPLLYSGLLTFQAILSVFLSTQLIAQSIFCKIVDSMSDFTLKYYFGLQANHN